MPSPGALTVVDDFVFCKSMFPFHPISASLLKMPRKRRGENSRVKNSSESPLVSRRSTRSSSQRSLEISLTKNDHTTETDDSVDSKPVTRSVSFGISGSEMTSSPDQARLLPRRRSTLRNLAIRARQEKESKSEKRRKKEKRKEEKRKNKERKQQQ